MVPYFVVFVCCICLFIATEKTNGILQNFLSGIGLLLPCLLAAFRDESVGTDVTVYVKPIFDTSLYSNYGSAMDAFGASQPIGLISLIWAVANIFHSFPVLLGILQAITIIPVYITLRSLLSKNIWIGMFLYLCLLFPVSLNIVKQAIAMSIMFLAFVYCVRRKPIVFSILSIIAVAMHQTAIIMFPLYIVYFLIVKKNQSGKTSLAKELTIRLTFYLSVILLVASGQFLVSFVSNLRGSYTYITTHTETSFSILPIIFYILLLCAYFVYSTSVDCKHNTELGENTANYVFFIEVMAEIGFLLMETSLISQGLNRFSYYFQYYCLLFIPLLSSHKNHNILSLVQFAIFALTAVTFIYNCLMGYQGIYPYTSMILGITQNT